MSLKTYLVIGGAGFIGSHTVDFLIHQGHKVVVLDNFSTGKRENLKQLEGNDRLSICEADVTGDFSKKINLLNLSESFNGIIHLAAQTSVISSIENPLEDITRNCSATVKVLEYAKERNIKNVVFASSAAVYGDTLQFPIQENVSCTPKSPYGINKLASEFYLEHYSKEHGLVVVPLRFFNVYGPRQDSKNSYSGVISLFLDQSINGKDIQIYGDGEQTRDFVFVNDVAKSIASAVDLQVSQKAINIATGNETSINSLARVIINSTQSSSEIKYSPARNGEIKRSVADITRVFDILGVKELTSIEVGINKTMEWYSSLN